jgi:hypothetical protein
MPWKQASSLDGSLFLSVLKEVEEVSLHFCKVSSTVCSIKVGAYFRLLASNPLCGFVR